MKIHSLNYSPQTFCSLHWEDIELYFHRREIKYCCRTTASHKFPDPLTKEWIRSNDIINDRRNYALNNWRHPACNQCWQQENETGTSFRTRKSYVDLERKVKNPENKKQYARYIKLYFENTCNHSCLYCNEKFSSLHAQERGIDPYDKYREEDMDVIIDWIRDLCQQEPEVLKHICVLGGEPTISKGWEVFKSKLMEDEVIRNSELIIDITSNGSFTDKVWYNIQEEVKKTTRWRWLYCLSNESTGAVSENVRYGSDWEVWKKNYERLLCLDEVAVIRISMSPNVFTIKDTYNFIDYVVSAAERLNPHKKIFFNSWNWVSQPSTLALNGLDIKHRSVLDASIRRVEEATCNIMKKDVMDYLIVLRDMIGTKPIRRHEVIGWLQHQNNSYKKGKIDEDLLMDQFTAP